MAGDFFAEVNGSSEPAAFATVPGPSSAYGTLLSLFAALAFLELGGPARAVKALAVLGTAPTDMRQLLTLVVQQVGDAIDLAVMIALPLVGVALALQVAWGLLARVAQPLALGTYLPALRSLAVLAVFGLLFQSLSWALVERVELALP
jgi:type III secretory pathway component EscT